jgi:hypothetical protein
MQKEVELDEHGKIALIPRRKFITIFDDEMEAKDYARRQNEVFKGLNRKFEVEPTGENGL